MGVTGVLGVGAVRDVPVVSDPAFIGASERWQMLGMLGRMVEQRSALEKCQSRPMAVLHTVLGAISPAVYRDSTVFIPCGRSIRGELRLAQPATSKAVRDSLVHGIPAFVLKGKLNQVTDFFRLDPASEVRVILANSGLFVCFGQLNHQDVVAYATNLPQYRRSIEHQFHGIGLGRKVLGSLAPEIILKGVDRMIVSRLPGTPVRIKKLTETELQNVIMTGLGPLLQIFSTSPVRRGGGDQAMIATTLNFLQNHPHVAKIPGACEYLSSWDRSNLPVVPVHGDYWADNLLLQNDQVSGVVDWDRSRELGSLGFDALTLGFMSYAMWADRVYLSDLLSDIWRPKENWRYPWLHEYTETVRTAFSLTQDDVKGVAVLLWMSTLMFNKDNQDQEFINAMYRPIFQT